MSTYTGYAPWVGGGTNTNPYDHDQMFGLSWSWAARRIMAGTTCYSPVDGRILYVPPGWEGRGDELVTTPRDVAERRINVGSGVIGSAALPDEMDVIADKIVAPSVGFPIVKGDLVEFAAFSRSRLAAITSRLAGVRPSSPWSRSPVTSAVEFLDEYRIGDAEAQRIWQHYRSVLNPMLPTPRVPAELIDFLDNTSIANLPRVRQIAALPDASSNQVRLADLAYELIVYTECDAALTAQGY